MLMPDKEMADIFFRIHTGYIDFPFIQNAPFRNINAGRKCSQLSVLNC